MSFLKDLTKAIVGTVKKDVAAIKEFVAKVKPVLNTIATDASDILKGNPPPSTGNKDADALLAILAKIAPYFIDNVAGFQAVVTELQTFLEGVESATS